MSCGSAVVFFYSIDNRFCLLAPVCLVGKPRLGGLRERYVRFFEVPAAYVKTKTSEEAPL